MILVAASPHGSEPDKARWIGFATSAVLHALLLIVIITTFQSPRRGAPASSLPKAIQITMAPPAPPTPKVVVPPRIDRPIIPPPPKALADAVPIPVPRPKPKVQPPKEVAKPSGAQTRTPTPTAPPVPPVETPEESLLGRIHDNWLSPARRPRNFNCRIRIDYLAGGRIREVAFLSACGEYDLEESVRKAIWKSQPLPLIEAKTAAGSIEIEFTP